MRLLEDCRADAGIGGKLFICWALGRVLALGSEADEEYKVG